MKSPIPITTITCLGLLSAASMANEMPLARDLSVDVPELASIIDSKISSAVEDVKSAYTSVATHLPSGLVSHVVGAALATETTSGASSSAVAHSFMDCGVLGVITGMVVLFA
jgi:hypothetical protein